MDKHFSDALVEEFEITEAKKKKNVCSSITYTTGCPKYNMDMFNKLNGTDNSGALSGTIDGNASTQAMSADTGMGDAGGMGEALEKKDIDFLVKDEEEAVKGYEDKINVSDSDAEKEVLAHIRDEEKEHIDELNDLADITTKAEEERSELAEAKRYVRRYYIRPQNIFCSNKAEIIKALIDVGSENCTIYTLNNLGDEKDVTKLTNNDIIYYYDDEILYDKNHVKVMDYDLYIKHEENRDKIETDAVSDATMQDVYNDRMTDVTELPESLTEAKTKDPADFQTFGLTPSEQESFKKKAELTARYAINDAKRNPDFDFKAKRNMQKKIISGISASFGDSYWKYFAQWYDYFIEQSGIKAGRTAIKHRSEILNKINGIVANLTPEETKEAAEWFLDNTKEIKFRIPTVDMDEDELADKIVNNSKISIDQESALKLARETIDKFDRLQKEFKNKFPNAKKGVDFTYRSAANESDVAYNFWNMSGIIRFKKAISEAPESVKKLISQAIEVSHRNNENNAAIDLDSDQNFVPLYWFCITVLQLFNNDINFYKNVVESLDDEAFNQVFEAYDATGKKLTEEEKEICCICGEEIEGYGNNPEPFKHKGRCCDACNIKFVIPARLAELNKNED